MWKRVKGEGMIPSVSHIHTLMNTSEGLGFRILTQLGGWTTNILIGNVLEHLEKNVGIGKFWSLPAWLSQRLLLFVFYGWNVEQGFLRCLHNLADMINFSEIKYYACEEKKTKGGKKAEVLKVSRLFVWEVFGHLIQIPQDIRTGETTA